MEWDSMTLIERAQAAIAAHRLPLAATSRIWGGRGSGQCCSLCGEPIGSDDVEIELDTAVEGNAGVRFHARCHSLWQQVCRRLTGRADSPQGRGDH
jgi:hypothetical protein